MPELQGNQGSGGSRTGGVMPQVHVVATGSRFWDDEPIIRQALSELPPGSRIAHGACPTGADEIVDTVAQDMGFDVVRYPADWDRYGKRAGPIRNSHMVTLEHPSICLAFIPQGVLCRGTNDCIRKCARLHVPTCDIRRFRR